MYISVYIYTYTGTLVYTYIAVCALTFSLLTCLADQVCMPCARRQRQVISLTNNQILDVMRRLRWNDLWAPT